RSLFISCSSAVCPVGSSAGDAGAGPVGVVTVRAAVVVGDEPQHLRAAHVGGQVCGRLPVGHRPAVGHLHAVGVDAEGGVGRAVELLVVDAHVGGDGGARATEV